MNAIPAPQSWLTFHALNASDRAGMKEVRAAASPNKGKLRGIAARPVFDGIISHMAAPDGVAYRQDRVGGIAGWWCEPGEARTDAAIIHLHGGWFNWGSAEAYRHFAGHIARRAGASVFIPDYRLAPEHAFPAAIEDARACTDGLFGLGFRGVAVSGDSAGGNLALSLLSIYSGEPHPPGHIAGAVVFSPVTDLSLSGESWEKRAAAEPFFERDQVQELVHAYLEGHDPTDPVASPLFADLAGLPPLRVMVGEDEVLLDDALRYVESAVSAGVDAKADVWEGMAHGFMGNVGRFEAADVALEAAGAFLATCLAPKPES